MPANNSIVIADGAATPVNRTFSPKAIEDGILARFAEASGIPAVRNYLDVSVRPPVNSSGMYRVRYTIGVPASQVVNGVTLKHHENRFTGEFLIHESSTALEIDHLFAFNKNLQANVSFIEAVKTLTPYW